MHFSVFPGTGHGVSSPPHTAKASLAQGPSAPSSHSYQQKTDCSLSIHDPLALDTNSPQAIVPEDTVPKGCECGGRTFLEDPLCRAPQVKCLLSHSHKQETNSRESMFGVQGSSSTSALGSCYAALTKCIAVHPNCPPEMGAGTMAQGKVDRPTQPPEEPLGQWLCRSRR